MKRKQFSAFLILATILAMGCHDTIDDPDQPHYSDCAEASDHWKIVPSVNPSRFYARDIFFPTEEVGYIVGNAGTIMKTIDAGDSWQILNDLDSHNPVTKSILTTVYFINNEIGYIGNTDFNRSGDPTMGALLLKTTNGGITWTKNFNINIEEYNDLLFYNEHEGLALIHNAVHNQDKLMRTVNDGETWTDIPVPGKIIRSHSFESHGSTIYLLVADEMSNSQLAVSNDDGLNWILKPFPENETNNMYFINDTIGFINCGIHAFSETVYKTIDGGNSWQYLPYNPINQGAIVHFNSTQQGIVINDVYELHSSNGEGHFFTVAYKISETQDGGLTWKVTLVDPDCNLTGAFFSYSPEIFYLAEDQIQRFELK
jgi:photosystem II stability/assembly factor-like uncharacterized protein